MTLVFILECLITFNINFFNAGFQSRYTSIPSKPTFSHAGNDVTFTWRYHLTHSDRANFKVVVFGIWMNGDISIPLVSVLRNGSAIFYSNRVSWLGNKTMASFRLHKVSIDDDRVYGCKLDFGAFDVLDSVRLTVIGKNVTFNLPLFIPFIYIYKRYIKGIYNPLICGKMIHIKPRCQYDNPLSKIKKQKNKKT